MGAESGNPYMAAASMVGSAVGAYGTVMGAKANAKAMKKQASLLGQTNKEIQRRTDQNIASRFQQNRIEGSVSQAQTLAGGGMSGSVTDMDTSILQYKQAQQDAANMQTDASWEMRNNDFQAEQLNASAKMTKKAGYISAASSILGGTAGAYTAYKA